MEEFDRIIEFAIRTDVELYTAMPSGWKKITGSMTAPRGSTWIYNGKSYFSGQRKTALLVEKECLKNEVDSIEEKGRIFSTVKWSACSVPAGFHSRCRLYQRDSSYIWKIGYSDIWNW